MRSPWAFSLSSGPEGFAALAAEWQALADGLPGLNFIQCPQWAAAYMTCLCAAPQRLQWITARRDGRLEAVWPLELCQRGIGPFAVRELRGLSHAHMTLSDIAADTVQGPLWQALWQWLQHDSGLRWDVLTLPLVAEDAVLASVLAELPAAGVWAKAVDGSAWLDCSKPYEQLWKSVSANHRSSVTRGMKKAQERGPLRYETHGTDAAGLAQAMQHFLTIEASGWKGAQGGAVACSPDALAFYQQLLQTLGPRGQCEIDLLWMGETPIATIFWFRTAGTLHLQKIAYLEEVSSLGPGKLVMAYALQRACSAGDIHHVSFITRCPWADGWRTTVTPVWRHRLFRAGLKGRLVAMGTRAWAGFKAWAKAWLARWRATVAPAAGA